MKTILTDVLPYIFGSGGIILFILSWIRFRKKDAGTVDKLKAEASVLITDGALRIVERLSKDLDEARDEIEKLIKIADELKELHEKTKSIHIEQTKVLNDKLKEAKDLMEVKRKHCIEVKERIIKLQELLLMKQSGLSQDQLQGLINKLTELVELTTAYEKNH